MIYTPNNTKKDPVGSFLFGHFIIFLYISDIEGYTRMASDQIENKDTTEIRFSPDYLKVISSYGKVVRKWKGNKQILMFTSEKYPDRVFISKMSFSVLVSVCAQREHVDIPVSEFGVSDFEDYLKFVNAIGYPKSPGSRMQYSQKVNTYGQTVHHLLMSNKNSKYHLALARPGLFTPEDDKLIPPPPEKDPLKWIADISLNVDDVKELTSNVRLMGEPEIFGLSIANGVITIFIKDGSGEKQFTKVIDPQKVKCDPDFNTKAKDGDADIRIFNTSIFSTLAEFPVEFVMQVRYHAGVNMIALKAFGVHQSDNGMSPIELIIATQESRKHTNITTYDVIL